MFGNYISPLLNWEIAIKLLETNSVSFIIGITIYQSKDNASDLLYFVNSALSLFHTENDWCGKTVDFYIILVL